MRTAVILAMICFVLVGTGQAGFVYRDIYLHGGAPDVSAPYYLEQVGTEYAINWTFNYGSAGTQSSLSDVNLVAGISQGSITASDVGLGLNSGIGTLEGQSKPTSYGFAYMNNKTMTTPGVMFWTQEYQPDRSNLTAFEWFHNDNKNGVGLTTHTLAIRIGSQWYAKATSLAGASAWIYDSVAFSEDAADWKAFNFTPGVELDQDLSDNAVGSGALPPGNITGFGVYVKLSDVNPNAGHWSRIDAFTVVPEPMTLAVLACGGVALLRRRR